MINVEGDAIGAGIVAHLSKRELAEMNSNEKLNADTEESLDEYIHTNQHVVKTMQHENGAINMAFVGNDTQRTEL